MRFRSTLPIILVSSFAVSAQDGINIGTNRELMESISEKSFIAKRKAILKENLTLTAKEMSHFWPLYDSYLEELQRLREQRFLILGYLGENYDNMSDDDARTYIDTRLGLEESRNRLMRKWSKEFSKVLGARDLAKLIQIEFKIKAFVDAGIEEEIPLIR